MKYNYPKNYSVKPISEQSEILTKHFGSMVLQNGTDLSEQSEGIFAIPHYKLIAPTYNKAVMKVMKAITSTRNTYDYQSGNWTAQYLRQLSIKQNFWNAQKEEIILIPAQFGLIHRGKSVETVCTGLSNNELPLGIYECLIMLLTHPDRLQSYDNLWIDCPGDEYSLVAAAVFGYAPCVCFGGGGVRVGAHAVSVAHGRYGSASGFVPQSNLESGNLDAPCTPLNLDLAIKICKDNGLKVIRIKTIEEEL